MKRLSCLIVVLACICGCSAERPDLVGEWQSDAVPSADFGPIVYTLSLRTDSTFRLHPVPEDGSFVEDNRLTTFGSWEVTGPTSAVGTFRTFKPGAKLSLELVDPSTLKVVSDGDVITMKRNRARTTTKSTLSSEAAPSAAPSER